MGSAGRGAGLSAPLLQPVFDAADTSRMFGRGPRIDVARRVRSINWRSLALYGLALAVTVLVGWATSRVG